MSDSSTQFTLTAERIADIPALRVQRMDTPDAPIVLVLHGLGRHKESVLPALYGFAQAGFHAVAPDIVLHGERDGADTRDALLDSDYAGTVFRMVMGAASDIPRLLDALGTPQAAVHGISLGGYLTFAALLAEPRLCVASVAMGSPDWLGQMEMLGFGPGTPAYELVRPFSPLEHAADIYPPRPLLLLHGDADDVVPVAGVQRLYERLRPLYPTERLRLDITPGLGHRYTDEMLARSVAWTVRFFPTTDGN